MLLLEITRAVKGVSLLLECVLVGQMDSLCLAWLGLETQNVTILNLGLKESRLDFHELNHVRLDLLDIE